MRENIIYIYNKKLNKLIEKKISFLAPCFESSLRLGRI